ncbi:MULTISPECIES: fatty acid desaturase [Sorangium]|uniref:fatty acid desaturase n=1 Tax=Sorangium TaxID=39643 RepID=UPI001A90E807|nr:MULTISPECIES: fatty acid desaturase [Sorangium]
MQKIRLVNYRTPDVRRSTAQLTTSLMAFCLAWTLAWASLRVSYALTLLLAIPTAGCMVRLFVLQHDCGHGSLFRSRMANEIVGFFLGVLTMTPFQCWRRYHNTHHATSSNLDRRGYGDVRMLTVREYAGLSPRGKFAYRVYRSPLVLFGVGPFLQFVVRQRFAYYVPKDWKIERWSVHATNAAILACAYGMARLVGLAPFLAVQLPVMALAASMGVWLFYVQHQFDGTYWRRRPEWDYVSAGMLGSSYYVLPPVLRWFTASIGLHHIHHLDSKIPNYRLQECLDENPELARAPRLTLWSSLACASLKLWDEDAGRMVRTYALAQEESR